MSISRTRRGVRASLLAVGLVFVGALQAAAESEDLLYTVDVTDTTPAEDPCPFGETAPTWSPTFNASGLTTDTREWDLNGAISPLYDYIILGWSPGYDCSGILVDQTGTVSAAVADASPLSVTSLDCSGGSTCDAFSTTTVDFEIDVPSGTPVGPYPVEFTLTWTP